MEDNQNPHAINLETGNPLLNALSDEESDIMPLKSENWIARLLRSVRKPFLMLIITTLVIYGFVLVGNSLLSGVALMGLYAVVAVLFLISLFYFLIINSIKKHISRANIGYAFLGTGYLLIVQNLLLFLTFFFMLPTHSMFSIAIATYARVFYIPILFYFILTLPFALLNANILDSYAFSKKIFNFALSTIGAVMLYYICFILLILLIGVYFLIFPSPYNGTGGGGFALLYVFVGFAIYVPFAIAFFLLSVPFLVPKLLANKTSHRNFIQIGFMLFFVIIPSLLCIPLFSGLNSQIELETKQAAGDKAFSRNPLLLPSYLPPKVKIETSNDSSAEALHNVSYFCSNPTWHDFYLKESAVQTPPLTGNEDIITCPRCISAPNNLHTKRQITVNGENSFIIKDSYSDGSGAVYEMYWKHNDRLFTFKSVVSTCFIEQAKFDSMSNKEIDTLVISELTKIAESIK